MELRAHSSVKVKEKPDAKKQHPRVGQAGAVQVNTTADDTSCQVKFDSDGLVETVKIADLEILSQG
jgi:hypothetical protein